MPRLSSSQNHSGHSEEHIDNSAGADVENDNVIENEEVSDTEVDENSNFEQSEKMLFVSRNVRENNQNG